MPHGLASSQHSSFHSTAHPPEEDQNAPFKNSMIKEQMTQIRVKGDSILGILASSSANKRHQIVGNSNLENKEDNNKAIKLNDSPDSAGSKKKGVLMKYNKTHTGFYSPSNKEKLENKTFQEEPPFAKKDDFTLDHSDKHLIMN
jgi:hypothetical protein